ncbi:MAG: SRPBCC family protein [Actinomycetota bacterium]|nr:SRPBCC family protein [Actinomycetota bacterium]
MRLSESTVISAPPEVVWKYLSNLDNYLQFMSGITRWDVDGEQTTGLGARRRMLFKVGSAEVGGLIEVVEWNEPYDLAWSSVSGVDQRGRLRLRKAGKSSTRVELRYAYGVAGAGLAGMISERLSARTIRGHLRTSLAQLKRLVENERAVMSWDRASTGA